jgi:hypothetical protein
MNRSHSVRSNSTTSSQRGKPKGEWDGTTSITKPLSSYNSLKDTALASYFGKGHTRKHLVGSGLITDDGRIVHLNRGYSRVVVAEQQFTAAEREEELRGVQEFHLRKQLLARTSASKEKMEKDNRVNKSRLQEHRLLQKRKQERSTLMAKCHVGEEFSEERRRMTFNGLSEARRQYRMDWKRLNKVAPEKVVVSTAVRPAQEGDIVESDDSRDERAHSRSSSKSSHSRSRGRVGSQDSRASSSSAHSHSDAESPDSRKPKHDSARSRSSSPGSSAEQSPHASP